MAMAANAFAEDKKESRKTTGSLSYNVLTDTISWQSPPGNGCHDLTGQGLIPCRSWNIGI